MTTHRIRLAIVSTHPIQYYAPLFRAMSGHGPVQPRVFYTWSQAASGAVHDPGFDRSFSWDVPLLDGYEHEFVPNGASQPDGNRFFGIDNPSLAARIEAWDADAVLVYGWNLRSHLRLLRQLKGRIPVFFRGDSTLLDAQPPLRRTLRRALLAWVYRHIDVAIAVGRNNADYFAWCGLTQDRIEIAPHAIDVQRFAAPEHEAPARMWRSELGIGADTPTFLFAGKLVEKKDPLILLEAFRRAGEGCHLVIVGDGPLAPHIHAAAGSGRRIHLLPFQNQSLMPVVYRVGDVMILPSRGPGETWGLALNEAMASGRAVVASSVVGGARDLIDHGIEGWTFRSGDVAGLAAIIHDARMRGVQTLRNMGASARARSADWSTDVVASRMAAIIQQHVERRRSPVAAEQHP